MNTRSRNMLVLAVCATGMTAALLPAGPLTPPAGPVAPTTGPEPRIAINATNTPPNADYTFVISQPGSYYLQGNIVGELNKGGILISASGVTLDLNGFALMENPASDAVEETGIIALTPLRAVTVRNGTVSGWSNHGVNLFDVTGGLMESINGFSNSQGIIVGKGFLVRNCSSATSGASGFHALEEASFINCQAVQNVTGFDAGENCLVQGCTAARNFSSGIVIGTGTSCIGNVVTENGLHGISMASSNGGLIKDNTCRGNGTSSTVGCGIRLSGSDARVEGNVCIGNDRGISVESAGNFITRNICSGNTSLNWSVVTGNVCLVVSAATNGSAITGNAGGALPGSSDPNANFTY